MLKRFLVAALASCALAFDAAAQSDLPVPPEQDYTQAATGMVFPARAAGFERTRVTRYAPDGSDESAGYVLDNPDAEVVITVYVYPSPAAFAGDRIQACAAQFAGVQREIEGVYRDRTLVEETEARVTQAGVPYVGHSAVYALTSPNFMGRPNTLLRSEARLFCYVGGQWSVKYRISHPAGYDASGDVAAFMDAMPWTIAPETL